MGYELNKTVSLSWLARELGVEFHGKDISIREVSSLDRCESGALTFATVLSSQLNGVAVITTFENYHIDDFVNGYLITDSPRKLFVLAMNILNKEIGFSLYKLEPVIHSSVRLGDNVIIEKGCIVGENTIIEANVVLHSGTKIGKNCRIRANSCIGGDGFGFERLASGELLRFPHLGGVEIQDNVEIGSLNSIARGTLSDTVIGLGVKTDNLVHIAHNCIIGKNSIITACAELSGGVILGESVWVGPNASIIQKISIGSNSLIGIGAVVTKNVPDNCVFAGHPAKKIRDNN